VGKVGKPKRALWKTLPVWLVSLELKRRGLVHRAPNYALIEVSDERLEAFNQSTSSLGKDFDSVVVLWQAAVEPPKLGKRFVFVVQTEQLTSRWSLLDHCSDGFVFPLAAGASRDKAQQGQLKAQLFKFGGHCIAAFANLTTHFEPGSPLAETFTGPVLVASANPNEIVFDERFLNLKSKNLRTESEVEDLARVAKLSSSPILAITPEVHKPDGVQSASLPPSKQNRADLIEVLVRNASLAKVVNVRVARLWNSVWSDLGYSSATRVQPDQVRALAESRSGSRPKADELARAGTSLQILGGGR
jgi:hypothetical protein